MNLTNSTMSTSSSSTRSTSPTNVPGSAFAILGLTAPIVRALVDEGYSVPTPIQSRAIPPALDGRDLLGCAQTGTGKTAAFVLPILQRLAAARRTGAIRALVVTPTRELAAQIGERVGAYSKHLRTESGDRLRHVVVYGGVSQRNQELELGQRPDLMIATPGRLLDLVQQSIVRLDAVELLVLDEADRMLDMGFINDVRRILAKLPRARQTLFFSATMAPPIVELASDMVRNPVHVSVTPEATTAETVTHGVYFVEKADKRAQLEAVLASGNDERVIVFTRTKHGANRLAEQLLRSGITSAAIHGNKSQGARERALGGFRAGTLRVLVATDLAARGIDVDGVTLVVNYELPNVPESYVHRIGRTGRAGARGRAVSLCDSEERAYLRDIERLLRRRVPVLGGASEPAATATRSSSAPAQPSPNAAARANATRPSSHRSSPLPQTSHRQGGQRAYANPTHRVDHADPSSRQAQPARGPSPTGGSNPQRPQVSNGERPTGAPRPDRRRFTH
jgi:ATP-dependent RNA helicase RhlE